MPEVQIAKFRVRQGLDAERLQVVLEPGELGYSTDTSRCVVGDGVTNGGITIGNRTYTVSGAMPSIPIGMMAGDFLFNSSTSALKILRADFVGQQATIDDFRPIIQGTITVGSPYLAISDSNVITLEPNQIDGTRLSQNIVLAGNPVILQSDRLQLKYNSSQFSSDANGLKIIGVDGSLITQGTIQANRLNSGTLGTGIVLNGNLLNLDVGAPLTVSGSNLQLSYDASLVSRSGSLSIASIDGSIVSVTNVGASGLNPATVNNGVGISNGNLVAVGVAPITINQNGINLDISPSFMVAGGQLELQHVNGALIDSNSTPINAIATSGIGAGLVVNNDQLTINYGQGLTATQADGLNLRLDPNTLTINGNNQLSIPPGVFLVTASGGLTATNNDVSILAGRGITTQSGSAEVYITSGLGFTADKRLYVTGVDGSAINTYTLPANALRLDTYGIGIYNNGSKIEAKLDNVTLTSTDTSAITVRYGETLTSGASGLDVKKQSTLVSDGTGLGVNLDLQIESISVQSFYSPAFGINGAGITESIVPLGEWQNALQGVMSYPLTADAWYSISGVSISAFNEAAISVTEAGDKGFYCYSISATSASMVSGYSISPTVIWKNKLPTGLLHAQTYSPDPNTVTVILYNATTTTIALTGNDFRIMCVTDGMYNTATLPR